MRVAAVAALAGGSTTANTPTHGPLLQALQFRLREDVKAAGGDLAAFDQLKDARALEYELDRVANRATRDKQVGGCGGVARRGSAHRTNAHRPHPVHTPGAQGEAGRGAGAAQAAAAAAAAGRGSGGQAGSRGGRRGDGRRPARVWRGEGERGGLDSPPPAPQLPLICTPASIPTCHAPTCNPRAAGKSTRGGGGRGARWRPAPACQHPRGLARASRFSFAPASPAPYSPSPHSIAPPQPTVDSRGPRPWSAAPALR